MGAQAIEMRVRAFRNEPNELYLHGGDVVARLRATIKKVEDELQLVKDEGLNTRAQVARAYGLAGAMLILRQEADVFDVACMEFGLQVQEEIGG